MLLVSLQSNVARALMLSENVSGTEGWGVAGVGKDWMQHCLDLRLKQISI